MGALGSFAPQVELVELPDTAGADQHTPARMVREQFSIPRLAHRSGADILHLTGFAAPWRAPCPVVLNVHDLVGVLFAKNFPPAARVYWSTYLPFTLRFADRIIVLSESTKNDVVRLAKIQPERIHVIPPGRNERMCPIQDRAALNAGRHRLGLPETFMLFVSTLEPRKGVDTLISAYALVAGQVPEGLVIVGRRGWFWERLLRQVEEYGLAGRVFFLDYVAASDLPLVYNLARAFVFPSRYEGFGLTPLEAMSCGTPVISTNVSSLPEVIGDAGILVPPDDADGLARAILNVIGDAELRQVLRTRGFKQARKFSWERAAQQTFRVYESVIDGRRAIE